jgi:hypothetical protein
VKNELKSMCQKKARNLVYDTTTAFVWQRAYPEFQAQTLPVVAQIIGRFRYIFLIILNENT